MSKNNSPRTQQRKDIKTFDYLLKLEKEFKDNTQDKVSVPYNVSEGDMSSVKHVDVTPVSLKNKISLV
ncbi:hypothetical protein HYZ05_02015 [Candidatus Daviesbacteria bacterium]|nr:hypothetical protein [Candidatus Daviesbacteria bacterium]